MLFQKREDGIPSIPENLSDNVLCGDGSDNAAVLGIVPVVTHHEEIIFGNGDGPKIASNRFLGSIVPDLGFPIHVQYPSRNFDSISREADDTFDVWCGAT